MLYACQSPQLVSIMESERWTCVVWSDERDTSKWQTIKTSEVPADPKQCLSVIVYADYPGSGMCIDKSDSLRHYVPHYMWTSANCDKRWSSWGVGLFLPNSASLTWTPLTFLVAVVRWNLSRLNNLSFWSYFIGFCRLAWRTNANSLFKTGPGKRWDAKMYLFNT